MTRKIPPRQKITDISTRESFEGRGGRQECPSGFDGGSLRGDNDQPLAHPREILLRAANGEKFIVRKAKYSWNNDGSIREDSVGIQEYLYYPTYSEQIDAAKAAIPYFSPKITPAKDSDDGNAESRLSSILESLGTKLHG